MFKDTEDFVDNVRQSKSTIYSKISLHKFLKKFPGSGKSTLSLHYFKNNLKWSRPCVKTTQHCLHSLEELRKWFYESLFFFLLFFPAKIFCHEIFFCCENIFLVLLWETFIIESIFLCCKNFFSCCENCSFAVKIFLLHYEFFWCCENFSFAARIFLWCWKNFSFTVRIFILLWKFLWYCENFSFAVRTFLLLWEFSS